MISGSPVKSTAPSEAARATAKQLFGSPAIDIGGEDLIPGEATDLGGSARPTDGDGDGVVLADAGAFEHPTEPVVDKTVRIVILGKHLRLSRRGVALLRLRCPRSGRTARVGLKVTPGRAAFVRRNRAARRVLAIAKVRDGAGNSGSTRKPMRIAAGRR